MGALDDEFLIPPFRKPLIMEAASYDAKIGNTSNDRQGRECAHRCVIIFSTQIY
jgi:hypothetical protein